MKQDKFLQNLMQDKRAENKSLLSSPNDEWEQIHQEILSFENSKIHKSNSKIKPYFITLLVLVTMSLSTFYYVNQKEMTTAKVINTYFNDHYFKTDQEFYSWID